MDDGVLGIATGASVQIDVNAAGYGWFIDETPGDDAEFDQDLRAVAFSEPYGRMDLLTVVMHELGHVLGRQHDQDESPGLMGESLATGERLLPELDNHRDSSVDEVFRELGLDSGPSVPADNMSGWQTTLMIVPTGGTGNVGFASATLPSSYIFSAIPTSGLSTSISTSTNPSDTLLSFDFNFPYTGGIPVPASANLLDLSFNVAAGATGSFGVFAFGLPSSEWTDSASPTPMAQAYSNVGTGGSVQIGAILVAGGAVIPEAFSFLTWSVLGGVGFVGYYLRWRRQRP